MVEYKVQCRYIKRTPGYNNYELTHGDAQEVEDMLNNYAKQGWVLKSVMNHGNAFHYVFEREV